MNRLQNIEKHLKSKSISSVGHLTILDSAGTQF